MAALLKPGVSAGLGRFAFTSVFAACIKTPYFTIRPITNGIYETNTLI